MLESLLKMLHSVDSLIATVDKVYCCCCYYYYYDYYDYDYHY